MKTSALLAFVLTAAVANAHTIMQKISVNGVDQGQLKGVRTPTSNNPIQNVNDQGMSCNNNLVNRDSSIINIPAGARVGAWWGHIIGGAQIPNDPDHPIAPSHKGPAIVYLAKVDNAASANPSGLKWFKIAEDGLDGSGKWGVDRMIQNGGWQYFNMPSCIAPGNYLMRTELIALHSAYSQGGAQFYLECAQINVTGSGTSSGDQLVNFPGAYPNNHPGIVISIYDANNQPTNGGRPYSIPGPAVVNCANAPPPTTIAPVPTTTAIPTPAPTTTVPTPPVGGTAPLYGQCGGSGWSGPTQCASGICKVSNEWYSQCLP